MTILSRCVEALKRAGAAPAEASRLHQLIMQVGGGPSYCTSKTCPPYGCHNKCFMTRESCRLQMMQIEENLFNIKMHHTPPGLRSLTRVFILFTPWLFGSSSLPIFPAISSRLFVGPATPSCC